MWLIKHGSALITVVSAIVAYSGLRSNRVVLSVMIVVRSVKDQITKTV